MALSWNEIKERAIRFSKEWVDAHNEEADAKPFLVDFFNVFGIIQKKVASFEHRVKKLGEFDGYIDLLWKGNLLIEMKSRGKNLDKAYTQAKDYLHGLAQLELPKYILVSDFQNFRLYDLEDDNIVEFPLSELVNNVQHFGFIAGYQKRHFKEQDPVNIKAAELMGRLHDKLKSVGYEGHPLELYLVRLLFILFADDTTIFDKDIFIDFLEQKTNPDGSDLAARLSELFYILNSPKEKRLKNIDEHLNRFPYINGKLFEENLPPASFDSGMRQTLIECCYLDWGKISPAIFGSMFQSVMNPVERRNLGAHYTSEKNILKLIKPLFLDELWNEFEQVKDNRSKLMEFHVKLSKLKFLDPACGCGNFLIITYRELRLLELEILRTLIKYGQSVMDISQIVMLDVDMMYGIEIEEFPARIAEVAMWLIDHQLNMIVSQEFGQYFARLPLKSSANIINANALQIDWEDVISKDNLSYILGNPPFIGSKMMKQEQRDAIVSLFDKSDGSGTLDFVTGWYLKAAKYIQNSKIKTAFVSTNSIVQGEQTSILWGKLINDYKIKIHFAHRTFKWSNEAKGNAAVYCVIIGFANYDTNSKYIFEYEDIKGEPHLIKANNINPYLVDAKDIFIGKKSNPICDVPKMIAGNVAYDYGYFVFEEKDMIEFIKKEPESELFFKKLIGGKELINNEIRYCLWLKDIEPSKLKSMKTVKELVNKVKNARLLAVDKGTQKLADRPHQFRDLNNPKMFIAIPKTSSENRKYIPISFFNEDFIPSDSIRVVENGSIYHFGVLTSLMHITWVKYTCGRLESRFRYSKDIVYNNFPWPNFFSASGNEKQIQSIEAAAQKVLATRAEFPNSSLADLYDPLTMPPKLVKAHNELDKAVDLAYRPQPFTSDAARMEFLFELYEKYTAGLFVSEKEKKRKK